MMLLDILPFTDVVALERAEEKLRAENMKAEADVVARIIKRWRWEVTSSKGGVPEKKDDVA